MPDDFDVVVVGGGPAGCVVALLLARQGCSVAVVDKSRRGRFCVGETLPPECSRLLTKLDLFTLFKAQGPLPSAGIMSAWGNPEPSVNDFLFSCHGNGWHIDRPRFNAMLKEAATRAGAVFFEETGIHSCVENAEGWRLLASCLESSRTLKCRLVVDARGRSTAGALGFPRRTIYDRLIAVAGLTPPSRLRCASDYTLVEAIDEGWFYSALLPCGEYMLAYMTDGDLYAAGRTRSRSFLAEQLAKAVRTLDRIEAVPESVGVFSAATTYRDAAAPRNWLAVGDATQSYDPLSGLGLWSAMNMARQSAPVIMDLLEGNVSSAREYQRSNRDAFSHYREAHRAYYSMECRWPESEFWRRRNG